MNDKKLYTAEEVVKIFIAQCNNYAAVAGRNKKVPTEMAKIVYDCHGIDGTEEHFCDRELSAYKTYKLGDKIKNGSLFSKHHD